MFYTLCILKLNRSIFYGASTKWWWFEWHPMVYIAPQGKWWEHCLMMTLWTLIRYSTCNQNIDYWFVTPTEFYVLTVLFFDNLPVNFHQSLTFSLFSGCLWHLILTRPPVEQTETAETAGTVVFCIRCQGEIIHRPDGINVRKVSSGRVSPSGNAFSDFVVEA